MSNLSDFFGTSAITPPAPVAVECNADAGAATARAIPTPANDGSFILLPTTNVGNIVLTAADATTATWTLAITDVHANVDNWNTCWWVDETDNALWGLGTDTGTAPDTHYLFKKLLTAPYTLTVVGSFQYDFASSQLFMTRAAAGSGDFTLRGGVELMSISSTTGAITVANVNQTQSGRAVSTSTVYATADGAILCGTIASLGAAGLGGGVWDAIRINNLQRSGMNRSVMLPRDSVRTPDILAGRPHFMNSTTLTLLTNFSTTSDRYGPAAFLRTDFDAWLARVCNKAGFPT